MTYLGTYPLAGRFNTVNDESNPDEENVALLEDDFDRAIAERLSDNSYDQ